VEHLQCPPVLKSMAISGTDLLEVPTIYNKVYVRGYVREYPHKIWPYMVQYLHFRILEFPLIKHGNGKYMRT